MKKLILIQLVFIFLGVASSAQKVHFDNEKWVEYVEGNMPLVISVPHGGSLLVDSLPIRDCKDAITGIDGGTIPLARAIQTYFKKTYNLVPHIIISHIARKHVDQNRELENLATCGYKQNEKAWYSFHNTVDSALNLATMNGQRAMYIDLHAHGHPNKRLEIGYNLTRDELAAILEDKFDENSKAHSIKNLLKMDKSLDFKALIFGDNAFGTMLVNNGVPTTPSKQDLVPTKDEKFFSGGDNTRRYTAARYNNVFGLQIETDGVSRAIANREKTAKGISEAAVSYLNLYGKTSLKAK